MTTVDTRQRRRARWSACAARFSTARQLSNFKYDGIYRNKSGGNKCGGGCASLKIAARDLTRTFPLLHRARISRNKNKARGQREKSADASEARGGERNGKTRRGEDATMNEKDGKGGDWQAFYYIPLVCRLDCPLWKCDCPPLSPWSRYGAES